jgi:general secretion pathway protein K
MDTSESSKTNCLNYREEKGAVLLLVLWVVLAISLLAVSFSATIRTEVDAARYLVEQKQAYYMARAGMEYAVYEILKTQSVSGNASMGPGFMGGGMPPVMRGNVSLNLTGGGFNVQIIDESGKINVNAAPDFVIFNLLLMVGMNEGAAAEVTDSILDWVDVDDMPRPLGAEIDYYLMNNPPYRTKNGPLSVPEELLLIKGITPEIFYGRKGLSQNGEPVEYFGLKKYLTTFSTGAAININSAPVPVLASLPGLDFSAALVIDQMRSEMPFTNMVQLEQGIAGLSGESSSYLGIIQSNVYTLNCAGRLDNSDVVSHIRAVVQVDPGSPRGYRILYWNEADSEL